jgi:hypothetical protein
VDLRGESGEVISRIFPSSSVTTIPFGIEADETGNTKSAVNFLIKCKENTLMGYLHLLHVGGKINEPPSCIFAYSK